MKYISGYQEQAQIWRALAHPVRLYILDILSCHEACVCHLTAILGKRQPYVSQQLATLREAGLVVSRREGALVHYNLADDRLVELLAQGKAVVRDLLGDDFVFASVPEGPLANCSCPRCQGHG